MVVKPYTEERIGNIINRVIKESSEEHELVWHRDRKDRIVEIIQSKGWKFQRDNELPFTLKKGDVLEIKKNTYHRVIKGEGDLVIKIKE